MLLIVQTGTPVARERRHGGFPHWIRVAAGLHRHAVRVVDVENDARLPAASGFDGVIVTGSGAMVTEHRDWSERCAGWLRDSVHANMPVFGICYGHQLLAYALGGTVGDNPHGREMGTVEISRTHVAADDCLFGALPNRFPAQTTHLQTVLESPSGTVLLATSRLDGCAAFRHGAHAWGVQFHPEFSAARMRGYVQARSDALHAEGRDASSMLAAIRATPQARRLLRRFVAFAQDRGRTRP